MNRGNERFYFEIANAADGPEILEILEESSFKGRIGLTYTRRPDPFNSFHLEGKDTVVAVCRDTRENKIVGFGAYTLRKLYVNGEAAEAGYLFGLRARKEYRGKYPLLARGYRFIGEMIAKHPVPYVLTTILEENRYAQKLLEKKRHFMPEYIPLTSYGTFVFKTGSRLKSIGGYRLKQAEIADLPELLAFLNQQGKRNQFYPVLDAESLVNGEFPGLKIEDFLILYDGANKIAACGAAWDQRGYKQYLLKEYGGVLKLIRPLTAVLKLFGLPPLPKPGNLLNFFTLSFWVVRDDDPGILEIYIHLVSARLKNYPFFVLGCGSEHPLIDTLKRSSSLSYWSKAYLVDWEKDGKPAKLDRRKPVYLECGLL